MEGNQKRSIRFTNQQLRKLVHGRVLSPATYFAIKKRKRQSYRSIYQNVSEEPFSLSRYDDKECLKLFRFTKEEIRVLAALLRVKGEFRLEHGNVFTGTNGLCILLRRLAYPNRLSDLVPLFARDPGTLSRICRWMTNYIYVNHSHRLQSLKQHWLTKEKLEELAKVVVHTDCLKLSIHQKCSTAGSGYDNIVGFIDGTCRPICRPTVNHQDHYSVYEKQYVLKYQSVVLANGIIGRLDGPFNGRCHDAEILNLSNIKDDFENVLTNADGTYFAVYGDPRYTDDKYIKVGFKQTSCLVLAEAHRQFHQTLSTLRESVEYGFGQIIQQFPFFDDKSNQKLHLQPLKQQYLVAALLVNCQTCLRGNQTSNFFNCNPPSIAEYLE